jgi:hypothetical protein
MDGPRANSVCTNFLATAATAAMAVLAASCSGGNGTSKTTQPPAADTPPASSTTDDAGDSTSGGDVNPDGIPYPQPSGGYGRSARSGNMPGSIMQNFKFLGYRGGMIASQTERIALADYYDPCSKRYKLIHLSVASVWCVPCNQETDALVAGKAQLDSQEVVVLQALDDGPVQGTGATPNDLNRWITSHKSNFTEMLDPNLTQLAGFFDAAAVPWNCDLDPRTMEIIHAETGWTGNIKTALAPSWAALAATPSVAPPASCN